MIDATKKCWSMPPPLPPLELRNISPIGKCIYCERTDNLTTKHIVPRGMKGTVTLPKGSCTTCAKVTKAIETYCMRATLLHPRVKYGLPTHPEEIPDSFPVLVTNWSGNETQRQIPLKDFPTIWEMPIYEYPGILLNKQPEETKFGVVHANIDDALIQKLVQLPGVKSIKATLGRVNSWTFARWIAKIGYCYAVARLGLETVRSSPLVDMIINGSTYPNYLVGGFNNLDIISGNFTLEPHTNEIFRVCLLDLTTNDKSYLAVYIRLLPILQSPTYISVVCEKT
jgi:hypothetical protein